MSHPRPQYFTIMHVVFLQMNKFSVGTCDLQGAQGTWVQIVQVAFVSKELLVQLAFREVIKG